MNQKIVNSKTDLDSQFPSECVDLCKNCSTPNIAAFCPNCGQSANTHIITLSGAFSNLISHLTDLDNKLFFTLRQMFLRPGQSSLKYVEGQRIRFIHPVKYFIVTMGLHILILTTLQAEGAIEDSRVILPNFINIPEKDTQAIAIWATQFGHLLMMALLPIYGFFLKLFFKNKHNTGENTVLLFYLWGNLAIVSMIFMLLNYWQKLEYTEYLRTLIFAIYSWWAISEFNRTRYLSGLWRAALSYFCYSISILLVALGLFKGYEIWLDLG